jgi:hypothetical protein
MAIERAEISLSFLGPISAAPSAAGPITYPEQGVQVWSAGLQ